MKSVHRSKAIRCWYSPDLQKKPRTTNVHVKPCQSTPSPKQTYQCPFIVAYSYVDYLKSRHLQKQNIFYKVKVTRVNLEHTCQLDTSCHRVAVQKSGKLQPNIELLNQIIDNMWQRPDYDTYHLRPVLESFMPASFGSVDAQACVNFRVRARNFYLKNGHLPTGMQEARSLLECLSRPAAAAHETLDTDDPFVKKNLRVMLEKILSSANSTCWHALRYLEECKKGAPGFDYRIWYKENGEPMGICWMAPEMRSTPIWKCTLP
jgi:hypothetical protein